MRAGGLPFFLVRQLIAYFVATSSSPTIWQCVLYAIFHVNSSPRLDTVAPDVIAAEHARLSEQHRFLLPSGKDLIISWIILHRYTKIILRALRLGDHHQ